DGQNGRRTRAQAVLERFELGTEPKSRLTHGRSSKKVCDGEEIRGPARSEPAGAIHRGGPTPRDRSFRLHAATCEAERVLQRTACSSANRRRYGCPRRARILRRGGEGKRSVSALFLLPHDRAAGIIALCTRRPIRGPPMITMLGSPRHCCD